MDTSDYGQMIAKSNVEWMLRDAKHKAEKIGVVLDLSICTMLDEESETEMFYISGDKKNGLPVLWSEDMTTLEVWAIVILEAVEAMSVKRNIPTGIAQRAQVG